MNWERQFLATAVMMSTEQKEDSPLAGRTVRTQMRSYSRLQGVGALSRTPLLGGGLWAWGLERSWSNGRRLSTMRRSYFLPATRTCFAVISPEFVERPIGFEVSDHLGIKEDLRRLPPPPYGFTAAFDHLVEKWREKMEIRWVRRAW